MLKDPKLAINGGAPVRAKGPWSAGIYHYRNEIERLKKVLAGPGLALARGANVMEFRARIAKLYRVKHVVTTSSGTTAIHVALAAAGVGPGDEVILSPITDYGSISGIFQLNAIPVFCDVAPHSCSLDPARLAAHITKYTKAIIAVHIAGYPCDVPGIIKIARKHKIKVIEDCAQSHLARIGRQYCGTFGDFGCFSTNESKHMKTGEGGFVICKDKNAAQYADLFADKCYHRFPGAPLTPAFPALNVRMSEIVAAIGCEQIKSLSARIRQRNRMGMIFERIITRYSLKPLASADNTGGSYWWFGFYLDQHKTALAPACFAKALTAEGIPCSVVRLGNISTWKIFKILDRNPNAFRTYRPLHLKKGFYLKTFPNTEWSCGRMLLSLGLNEHTTMNEARDLDGALGKIFSKKLND